MGAEIPAVNGSDVGCLEVGSALGTCAELEGAAACGVVMVVLSVSAGGLVQEVVGADDEVGGGQGLAGSDGSNFVKLAVEGVVELEADGWIGG